MKLSKSATEKDFFGHSCFTPDCTDSIIIKVEIIEENGTITTLKNNKPIEKLYKEKRKQERKLEKIIKKNCDAVYNKHQFPNNGAKATKLEPLFGEAVKQQASPIIQDDELEDTLQAQTDESPMDEMLKQENVNMILEMQELKDKFYKIQSERKLET